MESIKENVQAAGSERVYEGEGEAHKGSQKYSSSPKGEIGIHHLPESLCIEEIPV